MSEPKTVIVRRKVSERFTTLTNSVIHDKSLSWKALGLLVYLLSLPGDFKLNLAYLSRLRAASARDATRTGLKELERQGYLTIIRRRGSDGKFTDTTWLVTDLPSVAHRAQEDPRTGFPNVDLPTPAPRKEEKPTVLNTVVNKELSLQKTTTTDLHFPVKLSELERKAAERLVDTLPRDRAQALLDELASALEIKAIKKSAIGWFASIVERDRKGDFTPTGGLQIADRRRRAEADRMSATRQSIEQQAHHDGAAAVAAIARMKSIVKSHR